MSRTARREARHTGGHNIRINGKLVNICLARIVYKCAECLGDLERHNAGLRCKSNHNHRHFIHRDEAKIKIQEKQRLLDEMSQSYEIVNGQLVAKRR